MKIVLLTLSGDTKQARVMLAERYPQGEIETISRAEIEGGNFAARINTLRARRPDVFAVSTGRLAWQRGQNLFMLFGALAGAKRSVMLDAHGSLMEETRARLLFRAPVRLAREAALSAATLARARRGLGRLEREVERRAIKVETGAIQDARASGQERGGAMKEQGGVGPDVAYLRATPGAGTSVGGASSHINGVVNAMLRLGARVRFISNDAIAGVDQSKTPLTVIEPDPIGATRAIFDIHN